MSKIVIQNFIQDIRIIISDARTSAVRSVNHALTLMYWHIGERIIKEEQHGEEKGQNMENTLLKTYRKP